MLQHTGFISRVPEAIPTVHHRTTSQPAHDCRDALERSPGRMVWIIDVRVQLNSDPTLVADRLDGPEGRWKIDGAIAGNQVVMHASRRDVFQMKVADVRSE